MIEKVKMFSWLFGQHTDTRHRGTGWNKKWIIFPWPESRVLRLFFWLLSGMLMCPKCFLSSCPQLRERVVRAVTAIRAQDGGVIVSRPSELWLFLFLTDQSWTVCLCPWLEPGHQMVVQGRGEPLPSFILPVIRTQACPALLVVMVVVIVPKLTIIFVAGTIFARVNSCDVRTYRHSLCLLELESTENISSWTPLL